MSPRLERTADRMASCGSTASVLVHPTTNTTAATISRCRSPLCPFCARSRAAKVREQILSTVKAMAAPRIMVLTVKSTSRDLATQLRDLRHHFARLRRGPLWRTNVQAAIYTLEITINERTGQWHPHLHAIYDGNYIPWKQLQTAWHQITGGSKVVWIEQVESRANAAAELAKYIAKPARTAAWTDEQIREYARATAGARMIATCGTARNHAIDEADTDPPPDPYTFRLSLPRVVYLANQGNHAAQHALPLLARRFPAFAPYIWNECPQLQPEETEATRRANAIARLERIAAGQEAGPPTPKDTIEKPPPWDPNDIIAATVLVTYLCAIAEADGQQTDPRGAAAHQPTGTPAPTSPPEETAAAPRRARDPAWLSPDWQPRNALCSRN